MDPITHTLTGLTLSRAGLNRIAPYATPIALLAANAPDIDVLAAPWGTATYLHYHRHITHALIMLPVMAALAVLMVRPLARKKRFEWRGAYVIALAAVASHLLLDWFTAYGSRPLLPFSARWVSLDIMPMPDLWIWLALLIAWAAPAFSRLVSSEIGSRPTAGRGWAVFALAAVSIFTFGRWLAHGRAIEVLNSRLYQGSPAVRVAAFPSVANPFAWHGLVDTGDAYLRYEMNLLDEFDPASARVLHRRSPDQREGAAVKAASQTAAFRAFMSFARYPMWSFTPEGDNLRVDAWDVRFGGAGHRAFLATALVSPSGRVLDSRFAFK